MTPAVAKVRGVQYCAPMLPQEASRMDIGVEISLYPLRADFAPPIHEFLETSRATLTVCASSRTA